ncbi:MAG: hydroxyethylthiazole kinase [Armatimonadota bacterium]|nr:hydroxyethylthiazole kinase [Armatimonadota bacterium]MDR7519804.1 hydroxyethylthiazole kinase [Armatimonadota bacterium]MDR7549569.1 hydroxyethylthiazole kinase [Armatimonadota bacterium]
MALDVAGHAASLLERLRARRPLVHHLANFVTMQAVASVTRALGALPVMAIARGDAEQTAATADALVLSLGTPTPERLEAMLAAGRVAVDRRIPIVFDPVGAGATRYRHDAARRLLDGVRVTVVRANAGEAAALLGRSGLVRGVESVAEAETSDPPRVAPEAARALGCVVAVTGPYDAVADAHHTFIIEDGHPWLPAISGSGCMATAVVGSFCAVAADGEDDAVATDYAVAAAAGLACFRVAAALAAKEARGPGSLGSALLDALYHLTPDQAQQAARIRVV